MLPSKNVSVEATYLKRLIHRELVYVRLAGREQIEEGADLQIGQSTTIPENRNLESRPHSPALFHRRSIIGI